MAKKIYHPIDIREHRDVELFFAGAWMRARYMGWEPITEHDPRQPIKGGRYLITYSLIPYHVQTGKLVKHRLENVHASRVRPIGK